MANKVYEMTPTDLEAMAAGASDPNKFFKHFFKRPGVERAFQLDYNFKPGSEWQVNACLATQTFHVVIGGIGTGKTLGIIMAAAYHGCLTDGFKFLNIARESWQSQLMWQLFLDQFEGTLFEKLVTGLPKRPYPSVTIEFMIGERHYKSSYEFMSIGEEKDATNIFSWRGDWINIEEAGRIDNLTEIVSNLSTRLTGATATGRFYLGRMSLISNPWENPELWQMFDTAASDPENGLAINLNTEDNQNVTQKQRENSLKLIPEHQRDRFMTGMRPEETGRYYMKADVEKGKSELLAVQLMEAAKNKTPGYRIERFKFIGIYHYEIPRQDGRIYFQLGDPGTGTAPLRNAPCIQVWDVTDAPNSAILVAFYWGNGAGSIMPFTNQFVKWIKDYKPIFAGVDSTSSQKNMAELINQQFIFGKKLSVEKITGLDFSGGRRYAYLVALRLCLEGGVFQWPKSIIGISGQLLAYDPIEDRSTSSKLAQDIVATMGMAAFAIRGYFVFPDSEDKEGTQPNSITPPRSGRRISRRDRTSPTHPIAPR